MSSLPRTSGTTLAALRRLAAPAAAASSSSAPSSSRCCLATHASESSPASSSSSSSSSSSASSSSSWSPAAAPGTSPAYDAALRFISDQSAQVKRRIADVQSLSSLDAAEKARLTENLTVASEVNDPAIRWQFVNSREDDLDMASPTIRHLRERAWRKCGALDKLTARVRDQAVVPDSVSHISPTVDVQLLISDVAGSGVGDHTNGERPSGDVLPGVLVEQSHLMDEPLLRLTAFHTEPRKYTLAMVDLDRPDPATGDLVPYLHWLVTDIELAAGKQRLHTPDRKLAGNEVVAYTPPYPAKGSERHRYVTLLFEQSASSPSSASPPLRHGFPLRAFIQEHALSPAGIHFFRSEWTAKSEKSISRIWRRMNEVEEAWGTLNRRERKSMGGVGLSGYSGFDAASFGLDGSVELVEDVSVGGEAEGVSKVREQVVGE